MSTSNNPLHPLSNDDIERARNLIPGYLKKTLPTDDTAWMAHFLNTLNDHGGPTATAFEEEMRWVAHTQAQLAQSTPVFDTQKGWQRMQSRLVAAAPLQVTQVTPAAQANPPAAQQRRQAPKPSLLTWLKTQIKARIDKAVLTWQKPAIGALASAIIVGQMGLLAAVVKQMSHPDVVVAGVTPSSGSQTLEGSIVLAVVFKDEATLLQMRELLDSVQARVIGGPGAIGVWEVAVPKERLNEAIKALGAAKVVESVAPQ